MAPLLKLATLWLLTQAQDPLAPLDGLWAQRDDPAAASQMEPALARLAERHGQSEAWLWRAARWQCWLAELAPSPQLQGQRAERCWQLADQARSRDPGSAHAAYWAASGVGQWAQAKGVWQAIAQGAEQKLLERMELALRLDATVEEGGPWVMQGRYFQEAPWPRRDLARAERFYRLALDRFPQNVRARYYFADLLAQTGRKAQAREELGRVLTASRTADPPAARRVQEEARRLQQSLGGRR